MPINETQKVKLMYKKCMYSKLYENKLRHRRDPKVKKQIVHNIIFLQANCCKRKSKSFTNHK